jgi:hypothetical protein
VTKQYTEGVSFSDEETEMLKNTSRSEDLQAGLKQKLERSGLSALYPVLPRNITLLLNK